ncbi:DegT/DnrJ/EryC1/StrS family aminotransferase [Bacillus sp. FJAT-22090]|uniref:DegT/DnrJ/EryC1/StrS family aminotransferase n=1 Tax=Bacillus sp. FJAT-22090 TaxID=1581038 RepID=UPI0011A1AAE4|nr:DegT/DnrJ/EryC1/StrS family aminotransferase [Bacillus sp. FJAT-22090]
MNNRILLSSPHMCGNEQKYINEAFKTNWIAPLGPNVEKFERELARYVGIADAAAVSSGTAAIDLALNILGVGVGDIVFCSSLTFIASANPIVYRGATPVFIDSDFDTWNMSPQALKKAFIAASDRKKLPRAVIIVNLYGQSAQMDELIKICNEYDVPIIEDAAESLGSLYKGKKSGTFGTFGIYSFNGNKIITTSGGGMLISNDVEAIKHARFLATQARDEAKHYQHSMIGYNYRLSNVLAGIGLGQLEALNERIAQKRAIFGRYKDCLSSIEGISFSPELPNTFSNRWLSVMFLNPKRVSISINDLIDALDLENIEARPVWKPLHLQPIFQECEFYAHDEEIKVSEILFANGICLPSDTKMTAEQQMRVIEVIKNSVGCRT